MAVGQDIERAARAAIERVIASQRAIPLKDLARSAAQEIGHGDDLGTIDAIRRRIMALLEPWKKRH